MSNEFFVCSFTGHRDIPFGEKQTLKCRLKETLVKLIEEKDVRLFIAGGALGFDTMAAETVIELRGNYPEIKLRLALPCDDQTKRWKENDVLLYKHIMEKADDVVYTSHVYTAGCMHIRNRYMIDNSDFCVAYMTKETGGTAYTVNYAVKKGKKVINLG